MTAIFDLLRGRRPSLASGVASRSWVSFVPLSVALACTGGLLVGIVPGGQGPLASAVAYGVAGAIYGVVTSRLAASGYLPAPSSQ